METLLCEHCQTEIDRTAFIKTYKVCPSCDYHYRLTAYERLESLIDPDSFVEYDKTLYSVNPLDFPQYTEKLERDRARTGLLSDMLAGEASILGHRTMLAITDFGFVGGSMGSVVGEKIARTFERGIEKRLPVIIVSASGGGARMQEGTIALMQMAKTAAACARYSQAGLFFISVVANPTMGGVAASFASLGHVILAEPGALMGFAGNRARASIREQLPDDFQTAEFMLKHGLIDKIVHRHHMRQTLADLLDFYDG